MDKQTCIRLAKQEANKQQIAIAVVNDPIANAEDEGGPYGYCPPSGVKYLFRNGTVEETIYPDRDR